MTTTNQAAMVLGDCPDCQAEIAAADILVEYGHPMANRWSGLNALTVPRSSTPSNHA